MVGHGIGTHLHEEPYVPGYGVKHTGVLLKTGMTLAIESIINEGEDTIKFLDDHWTTKTMDGKLSAMYEHTVEIRPEKAVILTLP